VQPTRVSTRALRLIEATGEWLACRSQSWAIMKGAECVVDGGCVDSSGIAKEIRAMRLLELICIEGLDMRPRSSTTTVGQVIAENARRWWRLRPVRPR